VNVDDAVAAILVRLSDAHVDVLAMACEPLAVPSGGLGHAVAGAPPGTVDAVAALTSAWQQHPDLTGPGIALALRTGLRARQDADARRARPVWTGPGSVGEQRLTAATLHQLIRGAQQRILLVSYAAYTLPEIATDLEAAVQHGCQVDVVFETEEDSAGAYTGPGRPFEQLAGITRWRWPADQRASGAALHAKLLVVDGRRALVGSANLTHRALTANLEAGVLIADPDLAGGLEGHVRGLIDRGILQPESE